MTYQSLLSTHYLTKENIHSKYMGNCPTVTFTSKKENTKSIQYIFLKIISKAINSSEEKLWFFN